MCFNPDCPKRGASKLFLIDEHRVENSAFDGGGKSGISGPAVTAASALSSHSALQTLLLRLSLQTGFVIEAIPTKVNGRKKLNSDFS